MGPTALPRHTRERRRYSIDKAGVGVRRHELHTRESTGNQRPKERQPAGTIFSGGKVYPENLSVAKVVDTNRDKTRNVDNTATLTHLHREGVSPHICVRTLIKRPITELCHHLIQRPGKLRDLRLG